MVYLSQRALEGLRNYQYKAGGYTFLDDLHQPFWNYLTNLLPMWVAPNLITLAGTSAVFAAFLLNAYYLPEFAGEAPRWVYLSSAVAILVYVNMDCIDGKQARRTKSSSPLGQLFDHGCDALVMHIALANIACTLGEACGPKFALGMLGVFFPWILAQWEEYHTGIMLYGVGWFGVLEANYAMATFHFLTFLGGPGMWNLTPVKLVPALDGMVPPEVANVALRDIGIVFICCCGVFQGSIQIYRGFSADKSSMTDKERGLKELGFTPALFHLGILLFVHAVGLALTSIPYTGALQCRAAYTSFGVAYALIASVLIMCHMAKEPFKPPIWPVLLMATGLSLIQLQLLPPGVVVFSMAGIIVVGYLHWVVSVVNQVCQYLGIMCFRIKPVAQD